MDVTTNYKDWSDTIDRIENSDGGMYIDIKYVLYEAKDGRLHQIKYMPTDMIRGCMKRVYWNRRYPDRDKTLEFMVDIIKNNLISEGKSLEYVREYLKDFEEVQING